MVACAMIDISYGAHHECGILYGMGTPILEAC